MMGYLWASRLLCLLLVTVGIDGTHIVTPQSGMESQKTVASTVVPSDFALFLPMIIAQPPDVATNEILYVDDLHGFSLRYPASFEESPLHEEQCGMALQPASNDGWWFADDGDFLLQFGYLIYLQTKPAHGLTLTQSVDQLIEYLGDQQFVSRDDERLNREPRGYIVTASIQHHYNPVALFQRNDTIYLIHARMAQACIDEANGVTMESAFWQAVDSFRFR